jgi:hypothetical protein
MTITRILAIVAVCTLLFASSCIMEEKVLDVVVTGETSTPFSQNETEAQWSSPALIDVGQEIRQVLEDNGYDESDLKDAKMTSASYGVTAFGQAHDWAIAGTITVTYKLDTQVLVGYGLQSIQGAIGDKIAAPLQAPGVNLVNAALQDFLDGEDPALIFSINNETTTPAPSDADPMIFDWRAWLAIQVIINSTVEVPDPF